jgi:hypothetical protein
MQRESHLGDGRVGRNDSVEDFPVLGSEDNQFAGVAGVCSLDLGVVACPLGGM